jgi:hypothetical protein
MASGNPGAVHREIRDGSGSARIGLCVNWQEGNANPALANFLNLLRRRYPRLFEFVFALV